MITKRAIFQFHKGQRKTATAKNKASARANAKCDDEIFNRRRRAAFFALLAIVIFHVVAQKHFQRAEKRERKRKTDIKPAKMTRRN